MLLDIELKTLFTSRLVLRPMRKNDTQKIVEWRNSIRISSMSNNTKFHKITKSEHLKWFISTRGCRIDYVVEEAQQIRR